MPKLALADRAIVEIDGPDARALLERLITSSVENLRVGQAGYGALLTPQGKIISDFIVFPTGEAQFLLDAPRAAAADLAKRITLYKLRANVTVRVRPDDHAVVVGWDGEPVPTEAIATAPDPRHPELGWRAVLPAHGWDAGSRDRYDAHRIALGIPEAGYDFTLGDAFPHEADMDQLGGVDFRKGCYVGQEVVSRTQHRGTARTRIVTAVFGDEAPAPGTEIRVGERPIGRTGSAYRSRAIVTVRLDKAADAIGAGLTMLADGRALRLAKPEWASFAMPGEDASTAA